MGYVLGINGEWEIHGIYVSVHQFSLPYSSPKLVELGFERFHGYRSSKQPKLNGAPACPIQLGVQVWCHLSFRDHLRCALQQARAEPPHVVQGSKGLSSPKDWNGIPGNKVASFSKPEWNPMESERIWVNRVALKFGNHGYG
jgi:hypothetical protein